MQWVGVLLIDDWSRLMPLAVENRVVYEFGDEEDDFVLTHAWFAKLKDFAEDFKDHPSEAHAIQAAIVKALIAKKESEKW